METLEETDELKEMYYLYGVAAHNCCNIEYNLVRILLGPKWMEIEDLNPEKVAKAIDDLSKKTLGRLLREYRNHFKFPKKTLDQMELVLNKRNYLAHSFFGSYGRQMYEEGTIATMIEELTDMIGIFQAASHSLDPNRWK